MIIREIDIRRVSILKLEYDAPIRPHGYGPVALQIALERMQPECRLIHVFDDGRHIESRKDQPNTVHMLGVELARIVFLKQQFESLMPEARDYIAM
jgi:hypothetical protein